MAIPPQMICSPGMSTTLDATGDHLKNLNLGGIQEYSLPPPSSASIHLRNISHIKSFGELFSDRNGVSDVTSGCTDSHSSSSGNIAAFNDGGTTYFYNSAATDEMIGGAGDIHVAGRPVSSDVAVNENSGTPYLLPNFSAYFGTPGYVSDTHLRPPTNVPGSFGNNELRLEILKQQQIRHSQIDPESYPELPLEFDDYCQLFPLKSLPPSQSQPIPSNTSIFGGYTNSVYRATNIKTGMQSCLRRIHGYRLVNTKFMALVDKWKKLHHPNLVTLRQVFTTKAFGDQSLIFVYDFFPGAETFMKKQFGGQSKADYLTLDPFCADGARPYSQQKNNLLRQQAVLTQNAQFPESLIWTYIIQLTSVLRCIHTAGLACRTIDPTKIIIVKKHRLRINCCGIIDLLTVSSSTSTDSNNPLNAVAINHYQQEDLVSLGKIILAMACNSLMAIVRENLHASMEIVSTNYSNDLRNLIVYLLTNPTRIKSINDLMPMIGARFYTQIDASFTHNDIIEDEMAKDVEAVRLYRLLTKLCTVLDREEMGQDYAWSEYGDRYMLKLFRDYVFHQVLDDNRPWLDLSHVTSCLNKLDAGNCEKVCLMSRDEQNVLIVSFQELKHCLENSFEECCNTTNIHSAATVLEEHKQTY